MSKVSDIILDKELPEYYSVLTTSLMWANISQ
jgi:hypothetical protein